MFRILSIDGGGLRGIVPVQVLKHIETITGRNIIDCFDMFAGTSTGGLITSGLTVKGEDGFTPRHTVEDIERIYLEEGQTIFPIRSKYHAWKRRQVWTYLCRPQFEADGLQSVLERLLTDDNGNQLRIDDCLKPVFISAYDLATNSPLFFKKRYAFDDAKYNAKLVDICRATSAGPTYLPTYSFDYPHEYGKLKTKRVTAIDGGVFINNPAMGALVEILKYKKHPIYNNPKLKNEDIFILSIGTGHHSENIAKDSEHWGKLRWIKPSIDIMMWGNSQSVDYQVKEGLNFPGSNKINYLRINVDIEDKKYADMADSAPETLAYMQERVRADYLNNATIQNELNQFIQDAGL